MSLHLAAIVGALPADPLLTDLSALQAIVARSYPAIVSERTSANANAWLIDGIAHTKKLPKQILNETDRLSLLQYYLAGFADPHLRLIIDSPVEAQWAGFNLSDHAGQATVSSIATAWPTVLPPVGARILSCDGLDFQTYVDTRIAPFSDRRSILAARRLHLALMTNRSSIFPLLHTPPTMKCTFDVDGQTTPFSLHWRSTLEGLRRSFPSPQSGITLEMPAENIIWLTAQTFSGIDSALIQPLLDQLAALTVESAVVIDLRGNGGGDSLIGHQILRALLKETMPSASSSARWRVSALAERTLKSHVDIARNRNDYHADTLVLQWQAMKAALEKDEVWISDNSMPESLPPMHGEPFKGPLLLLTDARCMSACLTFMQVALKYAGTVHIGQETGANTAFTEAGYATLPSGALVQIPLKEHIEEILSSGSPLIPKIPYPCELESDSMVREWAIRLAAERLAARRIEPPNERE